MLNCEHVSHDLCAPGDRQRALVTLSTVVSNLPFLLNSLVLGETYLEGRLGVVSEWK